MTDLGSRDTDPADPPHGGSDGALRDEADAFPLNAALERAASFFEDDGQLADAQEGYLDLRAQFEAACRALRGRGEELLITYGELSDAFLHLPARQLLSQTVGQTPLLRHLDGRQVFVHIVQEWMRDAEPEELTVGLSVLRYMVLQQPNASVHAPAIFSDVVVDLLSRGRSERSATILGSGLRLAEDAAFIVPPTSALVAVTQRQRGECARELYLLTGNTGALTEALIASRAAVAASPYREGDALSRNGPLPDFPYLSETEDPRHATGRVRAGHLALLARCVLDEHTLTGNEDTLGAAVAALRESLAIAPPDDPDLPGYQLCLAGALTAPLAGHDPAGRAADLDEALQLATAGKGADGGAELGRLLEVQFRRTGDLRLLRRAVQALEQGEGVARDARLGHVLTTLYEQVRDSALLERALGLHRSALAATADTDRARPGRLAAHAEALVLYGERNSDPARLREATGCYRVALNGPLPVLPREVVALRTGLALALYRLGLVVADAAEARNEAVLLARAVASEFPVGHPQRATALMPLTPVLASGLASQARTSGTDLDQTVAVTREHVSRLPERDPTRPLRLMELGVALGERYGREAREDDRQDACAAFAHAARSAVLPAVTRCLAAREWAGLRAGAGDWPGAATAYRLAVDLLPGVAVRELRRDDQEFHLTSFARLASDAAAAVLRADGTAKDAVDLLERGRGILLGQALDRDPDARQGDIGLPAGPVVVVNGSAHGCAALVVMPDGVAHIPLPDLTVQEIADRSEAFTLAVEIALREDHAPEYRLAANRLVTGTLGWLWDVIAEPVLAEVRTDRLWWLPTGALSFLPLHAAGYHHDGSRRTVLDRAVSSYTPTLRMLHRSQARASRVGVPAAPLVVSLPETPGAAPLPGAATETEQLLRLRPNARVLRGQEAGREATLAALPSGGWAHFACHAVSDPIEPSASHLVLADGPLSVLDISRLRIEGAELAYLSACSTARGGADLADEAIHIGSAFQLAGYPHVVATLWPIADQAAAMMAGTIYRTLGDGPAAAVHAAARQLRDACAGRSPLLWASHVHLGA